MNFYTHDGFTDCFLQIKHFNKEYIFARWWIQGATKAWPATDYEIIPCNITKQKEFKEYVPKNLQFIV